MVDMMLERQPSQGLKYVPRLLMAMQHGGWKIALDSFLTIIFLASALSYFHDNHVAWASFFLLAAAISASQAIMQIIRRRRAQPSVTVNSR
jgi:hypothetical protein